MTASPYLLAVCLALQGLENASHEQALAIERRAKEARASISSGRARVTDVTVDFNFPDGQPIEDGSRPTREYDIYFEADRFRIDNSYSVSVVNEKNFLWHGVGQHGQNLAVDVRPREDGLKRILDLRVFGVACEPFSGLASLRLDDCLERADRVSSQVETLEDHDGRVIHVVRIERERLGRMSYWFDPHRDWNVIHMEVEGEHRGDVLLDTLDCRLRLFGDVWFPEEVRFTRKGNGFLLFENTTTLSDVEFNVDLPDELFTMAGMDVPPGTLIHDTTADVSPPKFWDGAEPSDYARTEEPQPSHDWTVAFIVTNVFLAAVFLLLYVRRKRKESRR